MVLCLIGLGANEGDRVGSLLTALDELQRQPHVAVRRVSSFVETTPVGGPPGQRNFFNAAAIIETELTPTALMELLLAIEAKLGRQRTECWGPRTIDLDLLLYGEAAMNDPAVVVPHPRMHERRFVLAPAAQIAADWVHPRKQESIERLLAALPADNNDATGMQVFTTPADIRTFTQTLQRQGKRVGLVPTMGALHAGHLSLIAAAHGRADAVIATIFVNPTQFGPSEDFTRYPRTLDDDLSALSRAGCTAVFVPAADDIYPPGFSTYVEPPQVAHPLEGVCRPGHFRGVATVVLKLFHLIPAEVACFGQKDYQQLLVIRRMASDLAVPIEIVACPTLREPDGLAMSSRNRYLSPAEREQALALSRALARAETLIREGEANASSIVSAMRATLTDAGINQIDYVALADPDTLAELATISGPAVALIAVRVGTTRLIDNRLFLPQ